MPTFLLSTAQTLVERLRDGKGSIYAHTLIQFALRDNKAAIEDIGVTQEELEELTRQTHQHIAWHWLEGLHRMYDFGNRHMFGEVHDMLVLHLALGRASLQEMDAQADVDKIMVVAVTPKTRATYLERAKEGLDLLHRGKLDGYYLMASSLLLAGLQPEDIGCSKEQVETWYMQARTTF